MNEQPRDDRTDHAASLLDRDRFAGNVLRGGLPQVPVRDALPTASVELRYSIIVVRGTPDVAYICLRDAGGVWGWRTAATG